MEVTLRDLELLKRVMPGCSAVYRLRGSVFETLFISPGLCALNGMSPEEYARLTAQDALDSVLPEDRAGLMEAVGCAVSAGEPLDCYFRVFHKTLGFDWAHLNARYCGDLDGCQIFLAVYTNASVETDVYQRILDHSSNVAYVCDCRSYEILYANRAARAYRRGDAPFSYGVPCYRYIQDRSAPCEDCFLKTVKPGGCLKRKRRNPLSGAWEQLSGEYISWCGHDAFVQYIVDITENEQKQLELRNLLAAQEFQLRVAQALSGPEDIDARINAALAIAGEYYQADRTYLIRIDEDRKTVSNTHEWCRHGVTPQIASLQNVGLDNLAPWMPYFERRTVVVVPDIEEIKERSAYEYETMSRQDIHSYIEAPIISNEKIIAFIGADNPSADKLQHSGDLLLSLAYLLASVIARAMNERQLQERKLELESIINNIPVGVSMFSRGKDGRTSSRIINPVLCDLLGLQPQTENADRFVAAHVHARDRAAMDAALSRLNAAGETAQCYFRYYRKKGEPPRWYLLNVRAVDYGGELLCFSCVSDVTAEREAENASRQSRRMYESAAELANLSVWVYDVRRHVIILSDNTATAADCKAFEIPRVVENVPASVAQWVDENDLEKMLSVYRAIDEGAPTVTCEYWYKKMPGVEPRCERIFYTTVFDEAGRPETAYGVGMDITAQVQERENYRQAIETLMSADTGAYAAYRLDLTKNLKIGGHSADPLLEKTLASDTAEGFFSDLASLIHDAAERENYLAVCDRGRLLAAFAAGRTSFCAEYHRRSQDGAVRCVHSNVSLVRNPDTGDVECVVYGRDVTAQRRDEQIFELVTNQEFDYVAILHMQANRIEFVKFNGRLAEKYRDTLWKHPGEQFDFDEIRRFTAGSWVDKDDRDYYLGSSSVSIVRRELDKNGHYEMSLRGHTLASPQDTMCRKIQHYYLNNDRDTVLIIQTDVTEAWKQQQKEAQRAKAEAERVQDILNSVASGICVLCMPDQDHLTGSYVNLQMFRILGYDPTGSEESRREIENSPLVADYLRDAFLAIYSEDRARVKNNFRDNYASQHFDVGSYRMVRKDGSLVWVSQELIFREDAPQGKIFYATYKVMDKEIELQNRLERQLQEEKHLRRQADAANEAKSDFLSRMSHDIRTPLNGIIGMTYLARRQQNSSETADCLGKIDTSSKFLLGLINDILDMSKAESNKIELHPEPYPSKEFSGYLGAVILPLCKGKNQQFTADVYLPDGIVPVMDKLRINQVVFNLLSNAVKFTPEGGSIIYRSHSRLLENGRLAMKIEVQDTGIGMSEKFQQVLFEPFSQEGRDDISETRGTGLGLAIARIMVEKMGGSISVQSKQGEGATFTVAIETDCVREETVRLQSVRENAASVCASLRGRHILLCEDHPLNQEIASALLQEKQIQVTTAENGQSGVDLFKRSSLGFYDAVLMDIRMPVMDGYEATRQIRALGRPDAAVVPIIAMTADAFVDDVQKCFEAGMNGHMAKPIDPDVLFVELAKLIK